MAKRITIINFKGGVGKTTLAFHLATGLVRYHEKKVLLIDMDHQSSLSLLCLESDQWEALSINGRTVNQIFLPFIKSGIPCPTGSIIEKNALCQKWNSQSNLYADLDLLASSFDLDDTEIHLTSTYKPPSSEWDKRTLVCHWLDSARVDEEYDYIIFDCAPATKIVSQNALAASHGYIVPVIPERMMSQGVEHLQKLVKSGIDSQLKSLSGNSFGNNLTTYVPDTHLIALAITQIQGAGSYSGHLNVHDNMLTDLKNVWGDRLIEPYIKRGAGMLESSEYRMPVYDLGGRPNVNYHNFPGKYKELTENLKAEIDKI